MAHLIKLTDYISRYQSNLQHYTSEFTSIKKERWRLYERRWKNDSTSYGGSRTSDTSEDDWFLDDKGFFLHLFSKIKSWFPSRNEGESEIESAVTFPTIDEQISSKSLEDVRKVFNSEMFEAQIRWASSSIAEQSSFDPKLKYDEQLKFFVQTFPDNYFVLYHPVFWVKQANVELDVILVSPTDVYCITMVEGHEYSVFEARTGRFWLEYINQQQKKRLSPFISLNRMHQLVDQFLRQHEIDMPIKKVVLSPNCLIDQTVNGVQATVIDKRSYPAWIERMKNHPSPIKSEQLNVAELLLSQCQTSAYKR